MVREFVRELDDLFVKKDLSLQDSLRIIGDKSVQYNKNFGSRRSVIKAGNYIGNALINGGSLDKAFKSCPYIDFDEQFIEFIRISEITGDLKKTVEYLNKKYERKYINKSKIIEVSIYPLFVILLSLSVSCFLCFYMKIEIVMMEKLVFFLILLIMAAFLILKNILSENRLYEAFLAIDFLTKGGNGIDTAVKMGAKIVGENTRLGKAFLGASEKLQYGIGFQKAFDFGEKYEDFFYLADKTGGENDVFERLALYIDEKYERRRRLCLRLIEPVFMVIAGFFMFAVIIKYFVPVIGNFNFL